jgi:hypothetical protein
LFHVNHFFVRQNTFIKQPKTKLKKALVPPVGLPRIFVGRAGFQKSPTRNPLPSATHFNFEPLHIIQNNLDLEDTECQ